MLLHKKDAHLSENSPYVCNAGFCPSISNFDPQMRSLLPPYSAVCLFFFVCLFLFFALGLFFFCFNMTNEILLYEHCKLSSRYLSLICKTIKNSQQIIYSSLSWRAELKTWLTLSLSYLGMLQSKMCPTVISTMPPKAFPLLCYYSYMNLKAKEENESFYTLELGFINDTPADSSKCCNCISGH